MKSLAEFAKTTLVGGILVILPIYLSILLMAKALSGILALLSPVAAQLPDWLPYRQLVTIGIAIGGCFLVGLAVRTGWGGRAKRSADRILLEKIPGYTLLRGFSGRFAGREEGEAFAVALVEIEEGLVPAFVIEQHEDGRYTVMVPSVPTPMAGSVYILPPERVHLVNVPLATALNVISRWGAGSKDLLQAMYRSP
ncbi:MAG: DUF502 domain-containing protein [Deltaproteobacteria bacterium]|nr:MAG: DUF502 domain-containing protein [Deltaproteobacteria bacterium]